MIDYSGWTQDFTGWACKALGNQLAKCKYYISERFMWIYIFSQ